MKIFLTLKKNPKFALVPGCASRLFALLVWAIFILLSPQVFAADTLAITSATLNGASSVNVLPGATISATVNEKNTGNANWRSTAWLISTTAPGTTTCVNTTDHDGSGGGGNFTNTFNITAPLVPGIYNTYFIAWSVDSPNCSGTSSSTFTLTNSVNVLAITNTTLADGTNPADVTIAPSASITDLDSFTLATNLLTDSVTALTVTLTGTNSYQGLSEVRITNSTGTTTYFSAVTNPGSNTISFSGGTPIPVTTTATTFKVRITPKTHANMPVPPGASYAVGGTVTAFTSTNAQSGTDSASATVTVDNLSPASATAVSGSAGTSSTTLNWTTSASADFTVTSGSVIYRWAAASAGTEVPSEGSTPAAGNTNGTATVACVVSTAASTALTRIDGSGGSADCTTAALTNGQAYTYKVFQKDSNGNYDVGVVMGAFTASAASSFNAVEHTDNATAGKIFTKIAGVAFALDLVALNTARNAINTSFSGVVKVELLNASDSSGALDANGCSSTWTVIQTLGTSQFLGTESGRKQNVSFTASNAWPNARVRVSYPATGTVTMIGCSTDNFAIRPAGLSITSNMTNTNTSGTPSAKAGSDNFTLTADSGLTIYNGTPKIDNTAVQAHSGAIQTGTVAGTFSAGVSGKASGSSFTYSEVGNFSFLGYDPTSDTASARGVYDDTFTAVDQSNDCDNNYSNNLSAAGKYGCKFGTTAAANTIYFGRFTPDHFALTQGTATPACSSVFTYFGQDGFTTTFTLTAQNSANATTVNYTGTGTSSFAKLDLTTWSNFGFTSASLPAGSTLSASGTAPTGSWSNGVAAVTAKHQASRPTAPAVETSVIVTAAPVDSDGVTMTAAQVAAGTPLRFGRLQLQNAHGSELLNLPIPLEAQYWNGTAYVRNASDSCTTIPPSSLVYSGFQSNLAACETHTVIFPAAMSGGRATLSLTKPGDGNSGSVNLAVNVGSTASGSTCANSSSSGATAANMPWFGINPSAKATFGIRKTPLIYLRENF